MLKMMMLFGALLVAGLAFSQPAFAAAEVCNGFDDDGDNSIDANDPDLVRPLCENQNGVCSGTQKPAYLCVAGTWRLCTASVYTSLLGSGTYKAVEDTINPDLVCDGQDNDCDAATDEAFVAAPTTCGVGACASTGVTSCAGQGVQDSCVVGTPAADDSLCNNIDDDCDGSVDEEFEVSQTTCGVGACASTGSLTCNAGTPVNSCVAGVPAADDSVCNGVDDDCDESVDEEYVPVGTDCGVGECYRTSTSSCEGGEVLSNCVPADPAIDDSVCNGLDDDCDTETDEEYAPEGTECGVGACYRASTSSCDFGQVSSNCVEGEPAADDSVCNGIDDDCDEGVDEEYVPEGTECGVGECYRTSTSSCEGGEVLSNCVPADPAIDDSVCNGLDDDCDTETDEEYAPEGTECGVGACYRTSTSSCDFGQVSSNCVEGEPAADDSVCDGIDDDCDESVDEEYAVSDTACGVGACASTGFLTCQGGAEVDSCEAGLPAENDATCDGLDDDCSGAADEDYLAPGTECGVGECFAEGQNVCSHDPLECPVTEATPFDADICLASDPTRGPDDWCACLGDLVATDPALANLICCDVQAPFGPVAPEGLEYCQAVTAIPSETVACVVDTCVAGLPTAEVCDGLDNDCDGSTEDDGVDEAWYQTECDGEDADLCAEGFSQCQGGFRVCDDANDVDLDLCDGQDNDCNEATLDGSAEAWLGGACDGADDDLCNEGQFQCEGGGQICDDPNDADPDLCDGLDNDCDEGTVDGSAEAWYGAACDGTDADRCDEGTFVCVQSTQTCDDPNTVNLEVCDGVDNDCNGKTDSADGPAMLANDRPLCEKQSGVCAGTLKSLAMCRNGAWQDCTATTYGVLTDGAYQEVEDNACDGVDTNCDGTDDESYLPTPTFCGVGACAAEGTTTCVGGDIGDNCVAGEPAQNDATCDGIDDDCDSDQQGGGTDEDFVGTPTFCGTGACVAEGLTTCAEGLSGDSCVAGTPAADDATCDGVDDDCDESTDEEYAQAESCGTGVCATSIDLTCSHDPVECGAAAPYDPQECRALDPLQDPTEGWCSCLDLFVSDPELQMLAQAQCCQNLPEPWLPGNPLALDYCLAVTQNLGEPVACVLGSGSCEPLATTGDDTDCDGLDDDCDGLDDNHYVDDESCFRSGVCAGGNTASSCVDGQETACQTGEPTGDDVDCNGVDENCDGTNDDGYVTTPTTCGTGVCYAEGAIVCDTGAEVDTCAQNAQTGQDDDCDALDNNCDGMTDENYEAPETTCGTGGCGSTGVLACFHDALCGGNPWAGGGGFGVACLVDTCVENEPTAEVCDGVDNDCNGKTDTQDGASMLANDWPLCEKQDGVCQGARKALSLCQGGQWEECRAVNYLMRSPAFQATEIPGCDGMDNDCDAQTDETWFATATACGDGVCAAMGVMDCVDGEVVDTCAPLPPIGDDSNCDLVDDDCDGAADNNYVADTSCFLPGVCADGNYASECNDGVVTPCFQDHEPATNYDECNGLDDDCNGEVDEDQPVIGPVWCGVGACKAFGMQVCENGGPVDDCTEEQPLSETDTTCDDIDDNCNSTVDEDYVTFEGATTCGLGVCFAHSAWQCVDGVEQDICTDGTPLAQEDTTCDGVDDDCNGEADEDYVSDETCFLPGYCASANVGSTCVAAQVTACQTGTALSADDTTCDGVDDNCNGSDDEDYASAGACTLAGQLGDCANGLDACVEGAPACEQQVFVGCPLRVFVTSGSWNANFAQYDTVGGDGLVGGDVLCQQAADNAELGGTWHAWLSSTTVDAITRVDDEMYSLLDATKICDDLATLTDGSVDHIIDITENGDVGTLIDIHTGTGADGVFNIYSCDDWTLSTGGFQSFGRVGTTDRWTDGWGTGCSSLMGLYCFEVR